MSLLAEMNDSDLRDVMAECYKSTEMYAKIFHAPYFYRPFCDIHKQIFAALDNKEKRFKNKKIFLAPRGFGKSTIINIVYPAKKIVFQDTNYIVPLSFSAERAIEESENLKRELMINELIIKMFGNLKSDRWSEKRWDTSTGIRVFPRGSGQQVRGMRYKMYRPKTITGDDLDDPEMVRSEERVREHIAWFLTDVCNSVDMGSNDWEINVIGTLLSHYCLAQTLVDASDWDSFVFQLCDENFKSNWPEYKTDAEILQMVEGHREKGILEKFFLEFMNDPIPKEDAVFKQEHFRYYDEEKEQLSKRVNVMNFIIVDPAKTVKMHSAYSAIICIGVDMLTGAIFVRDLVNERLHPDQLMDRAFGMAHQYKAKVIGIEVTSLDEFITWPFKNEMLRKGYTYQLVELKARAKKELRIKQAAPLFRQGLVYFNKQVTSVLEHQLLAYPKSKYWDAMDAFAYIVEMLEIGGMYMQNTEQDAELEKVYAALREEDEMPLRLPTLV